MDVNVINLVSSDEEDNDGGIRNKIKSNKNIIFKRVKPSKLSQNVNQIPVQKVTSPNVHPPNNNSKKQQIILANALNVQKLQQQKQPQQQQQHKKPPLQLYVNKIKSSDVKIIEGKKTLNVLQSGITITPIKNNNAIVTKNHNNSIVSNVGSITIKPRTETVKTVSKPITSSAIRVKPISPVNVAISTKPAKRIIPTKISDAITLRASSIEKSSDSDMLSRDSSTAANDDGTSHNTSNGTNKQINEQDEPVNKRPKLSNNEVKKLHEDYVHLIETCKNADPTDDRAMDKIVVKLEKYYHRAHTEFVNSKSFNKLVKNVTNEIKAQPKLVYMKINSLLDELRTRRSNGECAEQTIENQELLEVDEKKAKTIQKLSDALRTLQKQIRRCEETEVDWDDELNSKYLMTERYKKRACQIYEKLCDLTGESRTAERIVKKPIKFTGTSYPEFNRKLEKFVNETKSFPDMFDVLRIMDHCSRLHGYRLTKEDRKTVAQGAFHDVGVMLQKRRKADLYEMVQYFTANQSDPAVEDTSLKSKLEENQRHYSKRMKEVIERFSMHHGDSEANEDEDDKSPVKIKPKTISVNKQEPPTTSASSIQSTRDPLELSSNDDNELLDDSIVFVTDGGVDDYNNTDTIFINKNDAQALENEFMPTIKSVQSLHPSEFNDLMNFSSSQSAEIL